MQDPENAKNKPAEEIPAPELEAAKRLQQVSTQLIAADDGKALYEEIVDATMEILRADFASLQMLADEKEHEGELRLLAYRGFTALAAASFKWVRPTSPTSCGRALSNRKRAAIPDIERNEFLAGTEELNIFRQTGIRAMQTTPLLSRSGELLGAFSTHWREPRELSAAEISGLDVLARMAADLIERDRSERRLRESEERLRLFVENVREYALVQTDLAGCVTSWNRGAERLFGYSSGEMLGKPFSLVLIPEDQSAATLTKQLATAKTGRKTEEARWLLRQDGTRFWGLWVAEPMADDNGELRGFAVVLRDETERRRASEVELQRQKLESVGLLAGGIAHDFNNLLAGIMGNASLVVNQVSADCARNLRTIIATAERAASLTRQLLAYSGKDQYVVKDLDISELVQEVGSLVQFSIPKSVQLSVIVEHRLPRVRIDPTQFQQILMNLVINAGEAIGEGNTGRITIGTGMVDAETGFGDALGQEMPPGRYVSVEVQDTGRGIDEAIKPRIFDPFFTTKFAGRGLGLAAAAGIIRGQKCAITMESALGRGSTFRVFLPVVKNSAEQTEGQRTGEEQATVLVVDDESSVREFIAAALLQRGYCVLTAADGREALGVLDQRGLDQRGRALDAVVLDAVMPVMNARDFLPLLWERHPGAKVLLTSGYDEASARQLCAARPDVAFLQKPYTAEQLAGVMTELIAPQQNRDIAE
jgi:PAS domain S-box-containing protein